MSFVKHSTKRSTKPFVKRSSESSTPHLAAFTYSFKRPFGYNPLIPKSDLFMCELPIGVPVKSVRVLEFYRNICVAAYVKSTSHELPACTGALSTSADTIRNIIDSVGSPNLTPELNFPFDLTFEAFTDDTHMKLVDYPKLATTLEFPSEREYRAKNFVGVSDTIHALYHYIEAVLKVVSIIDPAYPIPRVEKWYSGHVDPHYLLCRIPRAADVMNTEERDVKKLLSDASHALCHAIKMKADYDDFKITMWKESMEPEASEADELDTEEDEKEFLVDMDMAEEKRLWDEVAVTENLENTGSFAYWAAVMAGASDAVAVTASKAIAKLTDSGLFSA